MKKVFVFFIFILLNISLFSQSFVSPEVVASSGGFFESDSGTKLSWTLGEIITETFVSSQVILNQGFQQKSYSFEVPPNSISENNFFSDLKIYPNPFSSFFKINLNMKNNENLKLELFSENGKKILIQILENGENTIFLPNNNSKFILLNIITNNKKIITTYKLIRLDK